jgi:hypothetical protein
MTTKTKNTHKNEFCYNMKNWPVAKESKPLLKEVVLDAIDAARNDLENGMGIDGSYLSEDSVINDFTDKKKIILLNRLEDIINGKPFKGISSSTDLILEELLHNLVSSHVIITLDMNDGEDDEDNYFADYANRIKKIYLLNANEKDADKQTIIDWFSEELWWDLDWQVFQIDTKAYDKKYLS